MSLITDTITAYLPPNHRRTPKGWVKFNAICCIHNGESRDVKGRAGVVLNSDGVSYHCFNCGFKTSWKPGRPLSLKFKNLLRWLSVPDEDITKCAFDALRLKDEEAPEMSYELAPKFFDHTLPKGAKPLAEWVKDPPQEIMPILKYLAERHYYLDDYNWYWTDDKALNNRLIIPYYYQNRLVGHTARLCRDSKVAKYLNEQQPGYVFNLDNQTYDRKFAIVTEGPLDAICVDGVAVLNNEVNPQQRFLINQLQKEIVVVPDRDEPGRKLIEKALEFDWSVSMPDWDKDVNDINDAVKKYGKLYTMYSIAEAKESNKLKIQLRMKKWI